MRWPDGWVEWGAASGVVLGLAGSVMGGMSLWWNMRRERTRLVVEVSIEPEVGVPAMTMWVKVRNT